MSDAKQKLAELRERQLEGPAADAVEVMDSIERDLPVKGKPVHWSLLRSVVLGLADWQMRTLQRNVEHLEKRIDGIQQKGLEYKGIHSRAVSYSKGDVVTHSGSLWIACRETSDTPGKTDQWQLISKGAKS